MSLLEIRNLRVEFDTAKGPFRALDGVDYTVDPGEVLAIVGESGSGKSVTMMSLMGLLPSPPAEVTQGEVLYQGRDVLKVAEQARRKLRGGEIGFVFQDPMTSLNPVFTVGYQLIEPLREHLGLTKKQARDRAAELLAMVGIPSPAARLNDYPHQFSGGMRQRVMIAIALACDPKVLIADEPTTALDVTIQAQILDLIQKLREELGMGVIWITHDLGVVAGIADRVMVMYGGQVAEHAPVRDLFDNPKHPYTRALMQTIPDISGERPDRLLSIAGQPPVLRARPSACPFAPRCGHVSDKCLSANPPIEDTGDGHDVACWWSPDSATSGEGLDAA